MQLIPAVRGSPKLQSAEIMATINPTKDGRNEPVAFKIAGKVRDANVIYGA